MHNSWPSIPLGDILVERQETPDPISLESGDIRIISKIGFDIGRIEFRADSQTKTKMILIRPGDLVLSGINAAKGAIAIYPDEEEQPASATIHYGAYEVNENKADKWFLWWLLRSNTFRAILNDSLPGGIKTELKAKRISPIKIPLPPLPEQRRIVAKIDKLVAKIEEARRLRFMTDELIKNFVVSLNFKLSGQSIVEIGSFLELDENRYRVEPDEYYPQVGIRGFGRGLFSKPKLGGSETSYQYFNRLQEGQIVLSQVKGWEGAIAVCPQELDGFYASPEYRTFACKQETSHAEYLDHLFRTPWVHKMLANATRGQGARRERTRPELFLVIQLPLPPYDKQVKAAKLLKSMSKISIIHNQSEAKFSALLPSILDKAFMGEI